MEGNDDGKRMYDGWKSNTEFVEEIEDSNDNAEDAKNADDGSDTSAAFEMANEDEVIDDAPTSTIDNEPTATK